MTSLHQTSEKTILRWWPTPQDYNEAVQNPAINFEDAELRDGEIFLGPLGLPVPVCGAFASVYRMRSARRELALRCFLRSVDDQQYRYNMISAFIKNNSLAATVDFEFAMQGIKINNAWFPVLKMEWVNGVTLDRFISDHLNDAATLDGTASKFVSLCQQMQHAGIAHGDLQHGNIMICNGELKLVDYDGMYVPEMLGLYANELGHRNYQHPKRFDAHFGPYLDNFSAWVIYASLITFARDPSLYERMGGGDDCLLFKADDFKAPSKSPVFALLEAHRDPEIVRLSRMVRANINLDPSAVPSLTTEVPDVELDSIEAEVATAHTNWQRQKFDGFVARLATAAAPKPTPVGFAKSVTASSPIESELFGAVPREVRVDPDVKSPDGFDLDGTVLLCLVGLAVALKELWPIVAMFVYMVYISKKIFLPIKHHSLICYGAVASTTSVWLKKGAFLDTSGLHSYSVRYEFLTADGKTIASTEIVRDNVAKVIERAKQATGSRLSVVYDEGNPHKCVLYLNSTYKAV